MENSDLTNDDDTTSGGDFIYAVNGLRSVRDEITNYDEDHTTSGGDFMLSVNAVMSVRDKVTNYLEE